MSEKYKRSLSFWTTSFYYLKIVENVTKETVEQGNQHVVISEEELSIEEYSNATDWSDFNISIPLLYNFYHGLELLLKGFVLFKRSGEEESLDHKIQLLFDKFKEDYPSETDLINILKKYLTSTPSLEPLKTFFQENRIGVNKFYDVLRYPQNKEGTREYTHLKLKYLGEEGATFFQTIMEDISKIKMLSVTLGESLKPT